MYLKSYENLKCSNSLCFKLFLSDPLENFTFLKKKLTKKGLNNLLGIAVNIYLLQLGQCE